MRIPIVFSLATLCFTAAAMAQVQPPVQISWTTAARGFKGRPQPVALTCPGGGWPATVWGTDIYTDDSSVCTAAVHAGLIDFSNGGTVFIEAKPGQPAYRASTRNGVRSESYQQWDGSFSVSAYTPPPPPAAPKPPPPPPTIAWTKNAIGLAPNGKRFTFICRPPAAAGVVKGVDVYSWDSSICNAAVHAGAITAARGGPVIIEMRPGEATYIGSVRNGVTSVAGGRTTLSFVVVR